MPSDICPPGPLHLTSTGLSDFITTSMDSDSIHFCLHTLHEVFSMLRFGMFLHSLYPRWVFQGLIEVFLRWGEWGKGSRKSQATLSIWTCAALMIPKLIFSLVISAPASIYPFTSVNSFPIKTPTGIIMADLQDVSWLKGQAAAVPTLTSSHPNMPSRYSENASLFNNFLPEQFS